MSSNASEFLTQFRYPGLPSPLLKPNINSSLAVVADFDTLAKEYLQWAARQKSFPSKRWIIKILQEQFGGLALSDFSVLLLERFQNAILASGRKPATANRYMATLYHMFTKAVGWEMMPVETLNRLRTVKLLPEHNRRLRYLSRSEAERLVGSCDHHLRPIVLTALHTGMRKGEVLRLRWDDVDLPNRLILLSQDQTKSGRRREIPLNNTVAGVLADLVPGRRSPWVFAGPDGRPYGDIKHSFGTACRKAGIMDFHFHDLRHTFASWLVMAGADLATVKELLGHASLTMTLRYAHLAPGHKAQAVRLLDH